MAGGRGGAAGGPVSCSGGGICGGAGVVAAGGAGRGPPGRPWLPRARWLARRVAALLVLLVLLAAGCALRRVRSAPPARRSPPRPGPPALLRDTAGTPQAAGAGAGLELPPLPSYEEVKNLPSYEEAQRCARERGGDCG